MNQETFQATLERNPASQYALGLEGVQPRVPFVHYRQDDNGNFFEAGRGMFTTEPAYTVDDDRWTVQALVEHGAAGLVSETLRLHDMGITPDGEGKFDVTRFTAVLSIIEDL